MSTSLIDVVDARREAAERIGRTDVRVLEPSPPAVNEPPWFADDPVTEAVAGGGGVSPVPNAATTWDQLGVDDPSLSEWCAARWLGGWKRLPEVLPDAFVETRTALHGLAQHVFSAARYRANGKIGLRFTRAGFGTPFFGDDRQLRLERGELVLQDGSNEERRPLSTVGEAARFAGVEAGHPHDVFEATVPLTPDAPLAVDGAAAALLGDWFGFAWSVLETARVMWDVADSRVQLWPEHFDPAFEAGDAERGERASFGCSPGDDAHVGPYLYVSPWSPPSDNAYWNDSTFRGASLAYADLVSADDQRQAAMDFFVRGRELLQ